MAEQTILAVSLKEYKQQIRDLQQELMNLTRGSEEYKQKAKECSMMQQQLNQVMKDSRNTIEAEEGSYNALAKRMAELKEQAKSTADAGLRDALSKEINSLNTQLSKMDAKMGTFGRNVGNYQSAWMGVMNGMRNFPQMMMSVVGALATGTVTIEGMSVALKGLYSALGPVGIALIALTVAFKAIKEGISASGEQSDRWALVMAKFRPLLNLLKNALDVVTSGVLWFAEGLATTFDLLTKVIGLVVQFSGVVMKFLGFEEAGKSTEKLGKNIVFATNKTVELTKAEQKYRDEKIKTGHINEDLMKREQELREQASDFETYSAKERIKYLKEAHEIQIQILKNNKTLAYQEWQLAVRRAKESPTSNEEKKHIAELEDAYKRSKTAIDQENTAYNKQNKKLHSEAKKEAKSTTSALNSASDERQRKIQEEIEKNKELVKSIEDVKKAYIDSNKTPQQKLQEEYNDAIGKIPDYEKALKSLGYSPDKIKQKVDEYRSIVEERLTKGFEKLGSSEIAKSLKEGIDDIKTNTERDLKTLQFTYDINDAYDTEGKTPEEKFKQETDRQNAIFEIKKKGLEDQRNLLLEQENNMQLTEEERTAIKKQIAELTNQIDDLSTQHQIDNLIRLNNFGKQMADEEKKRDEEKAKNKKATYFKMASSIESVLSSVGDAYKAEIDQKVKDGKITEEEAKKEFKRVKALQYATTLISTIAGATQIYMDTMKDPAIDPTWLREPMAIANMTATLAAGYAQLKTIQSTEYGSTSSSSSSSSGGGSISAQPTLDQTTDTNSMQSLNITGNSDKNKDTRVYVLESDITDTQNKVKVKENNSTF